MAFCWLPPERASIRVSIEGALTRRESKILLTSSFSFFLFMKILPDSLGRLASDIFSRMLSIQTMPLRLRSSVKKPMPARMASCGLCISTFLPWI